MQDPNIQEWGVEEEDDGDPPRLWSPAGNYPGTAFTRSIGDSGQRGPVGVQAVCPLCQEGTLLCYRSCECICWCVT